MKTPAVLRVLCVQNPNAEDAKGRRGKLRNAFTAKAQSAARRTWNERLLRLGAPSGLGLPDGTAVAVGGAGAHGAWGSVSGRPFQVRGFRSQDFQQACHGSRRPPILRQPRKKTPTTAALEKNQCGGIPRRGERAWLLPEYKTGDGGSGGPPGGVLPAFVNAGGHPRDHEKKDPGRHTEKHIKTCLYLQLS